MFINKDSIIINGINIGQYLTEAKFGYNKLWANDSGRNLAGTMSGTLLGIFPKIILQFRALNKTELENGNPSIIQILDSPTQVVTYYDPNKKTNVTMTTYTGDYEIVNKDIINNDIPNEPFSCSFIAIRKRA